MKRILFLVMVCLYGMASWAQEEIKWLRASSISPDGKTIVFEYKGDLYTVGANGGEAKRLTSNTAYDGYPHWSPDGKWIAFGSERSGGMDIYIISPEGGKPKRLTTNSASETIVGWLDNSHVLYTASIMPDIKDISFPGSFAQVYSVDIDAHRPAMFSSIPMEDISINAKGELLYHNNKGYEDYWRKHHQSPICRDIYLTQVSGKRSYKKLNDDMCEHRTPVWAPNGTDYYYTSEKDGTLNIYRASINGGKATQITHYKGFPVRYLTSSKQGTLCYSWDGGLYTIKEGGKPQRLTVTINSDDEERANQPRRVTSGASNMATNKDEKEFVFVVNGEVYVTNMDYATTCRITNTVEEERQPDLSPDGRTIIYASERNNTWGIYATTLVNSADKGFTYAIDLKEEPLITGEESFMFPKFSPDGNKIAYLANRSEIRVYDVKTKKSNVVMHGKDMFTYTDGGFTFRWSPDSKWILTEYYGEDNWNSCDIAIFSADGKEFHNLTRSGYTDGNPRWALGGKAITFVSDRAGYRSHGSWGSERDGYIMFLDREAYALAKMNKEERYLYDERKKATDEAAKDDKKDADKNKKDSDKDKKDSDTKDKKDTDAKDKKDAKDSVTVLKFDFEDCDKRIMRLTINSSSMGDGYLTPDGKKYFYITTHEGSTDMWLHDLEENSTRVFKKGFGGGQMFPDKTGENLFVCNGQMNKLNLKNGETKAISFNGEYTSNDLADMENTFSHIVNQIDKRFVDTKYHGIDFLPLAKHYGEFLPYINNYRDFSEMASELVGELNCSHSGVKYRASSSVPATAVLGAFYDPAHTGNGLKIAEILKNSPLDLPDQKIKAGHVITQIDHQPIKANEDYFPLLAGKAGKQLLLTIADEAGKTYETYVKPITTGQQTELLYNRWIEQRAAIVEKETGGKIGYVHIKGMNSESFRKTYADVLGRYRNCNSMIIDERHNGGGWLHNDLAILFSGKEYQKFESRGQKLGIDPFVQWTKPSCLLVTEDCYSNANGFPYTYKTLGIGKVIGAPMAGTMTAVWWENIAGGRLTLGIPQIYCVATNGKPLENQNFFPDIEVHNSPEDLVDGYDRQLLRAIEEMKK